MPAAISTRSLLVALAVLLTLALTAPAAAQDAPLQPPPPTGDYQQVLDVTFPTPLDVRFGDSYDACRSGCSRRHKATDLMGPKLTPLYATVDGRICHVAGEDGVEPHYGYAVTLCGDDGREYRYLHLNNDTPGTDDGRGGARWAFAPGIRRGVDVHRGQWLAYMGDSGNAEHTGSHLHLDIFDCAVVDPYGDNRINPYPSLVDARGRADFSADPGVPLDGTARTAGSDRLGTAIHLSAASWPAASQVVLSTAHEPGWPLISSSYAAHLGAPSLLTFPDQLDARVLTEIIRLGATEVTVVGPAADAVTAGLQAAGLQVDLVAGGDLFAVAATLAERIWQATDSDVAIVALGTHTDPTRAWPDALTGTALAAGVDAALVPVAPGSVPGPSTAVLERADRAVLVGGTAALDA